MMGQRIVESTSSNAADGSSRLYVVKSSREATQSIAQLYSRSRDYEYVEELIDKRGLKSAEIRSLSEEDNKFTEAPRHNYPSKTKVTYLGQIAILFRCRPTIISLPDVENNSPPYTNTAKAGDLCLTLRRVYREGQGILQVKSKLLLER